MLCKLLNRNSAIGFSFTAASFLLFFSFVEDDDEGREDVETQGSK